MILVTGASGFVGSALLRALLRSGRAVRVISRKERQAPASESRGLVDPRVADLERPATLDGTLDGVETIVHLAGALEGSEPGRMRAINVQGSRNLATAARQAGVRSFVHVSSAAVYGERRGLVLLKESDDTTPVSPYGLSKLDGERAVRESLAGGSVSLVVLRPTGVYGGGRLATQEMLRAVLRQPVRVHLPPQVIVHPTYIDDLVQCVLRAIDLPSATDQVVNVGGERPVSYESWLAMAAAALGSPMRQWSVPSGALALPARVLSAAAALAHAGAATRLARFGEPCVSTAVDASRAGRLLGYSPVPLALGMELTVAEAARIGAIHRPGSGST